MKHDFLFRTNSNTLKLLTLTLSFGLLVAVSCTEEKYRGDLLSLVLPSDHAHADITGLLLGSRFSSYEDLQQCVQIQYSDSDAPLKSWFGARPKVVLVHRSNNQTVTSILEGGVDQDDFRDARDGTFWEKVNLAIYSPYTAIMRDDLIRIFYLSRRRHHQFGSSDVAFYDLAERMACNILEDQYDMLSQRDTTEKGFINTFNHVTAQALMTSLFSEELADFIADVHERLRPELIVGDFTDEQLMDLEEGPLDNYVDMINNEWGQELGKKLTLKYSIDADTEWTPELLSDYLNDIQAYYQESLNLRFVPFTPQDYLVKRFAEKLNVVMGELPKFVKKE